MKDFTRRVAGLFLGILMLVTLLFSAFYLVMEWDHDCTGEDCPVCECLVQCQSYFHQLCDGMAAQMALLLVTGVIFMNATLAEGLPLPTLITWKVRLNP